MAFKDIVKEFYNGAVRLTYLDKAHRYYAQKRINWELPVDDPRAWSKKTMPKGTTTLLDQTIEHAGLMQWPKGLALGELFGYYNFTNDEGEKMEGFSKGKGTMWKNGKTAQITQDEALPVVRSASKAWEVKKKHGADVGSCVHNAIEHYITGVPYNILNEYTSSVMAAEYDNEEEKATAVQAIPEDVTQATAAFKQFTVWWTTKQPQLLSTEDLVYSREYDVAGTYDARLIMDGKMIIADWKTSNASKSKDANAPQGVYYSYFIQSAIYALAWHEMTGEMADDLLIVSCRKDGEFDTVFASDMGLDMEDCITWAKAIIFAYKFRERSRIALWQSGLDSGRVLAPIKKGSK